MALEDYWDFFLRSLQSQTMSFANALLDSECSDDYARAISNLLREIIGNSHSRSDWVDHLGLSACAIVVPSDLFVTPVFSVFSTHDWQIEPIDPILFWGPQTTMVNSFLSPVILKQGPIHLQFVGNRYPKSAAVPKSTVARGRLLPRPTLLVASEFLAYLSDWHENGGPFTRPNIEDQRLGNFLKHNVTPLKAYFHGDWEPGWAYTYCGAILELALLFGSRLPSANHIYILPAGFTDAYPGCFCFQFRSRLQHLHRLVLRWVSSTVFAFIRTLDNREVQRRMLLPSSALTRTLSITHTLRNSLATLENDLQALRIHFSNGAATKLHDDIEQSLITYSTVMKSVTRLEDAAVPGIPPGSSITIKSLIDFFFNDWGTPLYPRIFWFGPEPGGSETSDTTPFVLFGEVKELSDALFQFIEPVLVMGKEKLLHPTGPPTVGDDSNQNAVVLFAHFKHLTLEIWVSSGNRLPSNIRQAIYSVNLLGRLPSNKPAGGRGILSSIATIRNLFQGNCRLAVGFSEETHWIITLPIAMPEYNDVTTDAEGSSLSASSSNEECEP